MTHSHPAQEKRPDIVCTADEMNDALWYLHDHNMGITAETIMERLAFISEAGYRREDWQQGEYVVDRDGLVWLWRLQGEYVVDRDGLVWRVVRDGGMATRADYAGIESIGIEALRSTKGPLTSLNDFVDAAAGAVPAAPPKVVGE